MKIVLLESLGISDSVLEGYAEKLRAAGHEFAAYPKNTDPAVMIERAKDADIIMIANMPLPAEVINACPNLKYIDIAFTGVNHVAIDAAKARGIKASNAAGYSTEAVAELSLQMMLSLLRNVSAVEARCRAEGTKDGLVGCELRGKTVGIIGVGAIGTRTAELAHAFGCKVLGNKRHVKGDEPSYIEFVSLEELLKSSDIVSLHCPQTAETTGLINAERIAMMKDGALLINASRGPVVDSRALAEALNSGKLGGAGIDVFEMEPPIPSDHPLLNCKNTLVTPHVAFATKESMLARAEIVFDNIDAYLAGEQKNIVL